MNRKLALPMLLLVLSLASLACTIFVGGPEYPEQNVPVSVEAADSIKDQIKQAMEAGLETGTVTLELNESQLTSYLALRLEQQENPFMTDPQVYLQDGQMRVFGKVQRGMFIANVSVIISVGVNELGQPKIEVVSSDFGPFPAPEGLNAAIGGVVAEAYTGSLGPIATGFRLESVTISNGVMTLSGRVK